MPTMPFSMNPISRKSKMAAKRAHKQNSSAPHQGEREKARRRKQALRAHWKRMAAELITHRHSDIQGDRRAA